MKKYLLILLLIPSLCFSHIKRECIENGWIVWKTDTGWVLEYQNKAIFIKGTKEKFCSGVKK
jgi:hypothetical protein